MRDQVGVSAANAAPGWLTPRRPAAILLVGYAKPFLATHIGSNLMTYGVPIGIGVIVSAFSFSAATNLSKIGRWT